MECSFFCCSESLLGLRYLLLGRLCQLCLVVVNWLRDVLGKPCFEWFCRWSVDCRVVKGWFRSLFERGRNGSHRIIWITASSCFSFLVLSVHLVECWLWCIYWSVERLWGSRVPKSLVDRHFSWRPWFASWSISKWPIQPCWVFKLWQGFEVLCSCLIYLLLISHRPPVELLLCIIVPYCI